MAKKSKKTNPSATSAKISTKKLPGPDWAILGLAGVGVAITAYLTGVAWWGAGPLLCEPGSSCDVIQQSRWSTVLGLPLSLWGFLVYLVLAFIAFRPMAPAKRWTWLWRISVAGLAMSLYLTLVGIIALNAVCLWCLASLGVIASIFTVLALQRPPAAATPGAPWWHLPLNSAIMAVVVVALMHIYYNSDLLTPPPDARLQALAEHLDETGARYYGASWCASCQQQGRLFRDAAEALPYIECSPFGQGGPMASACVQQNITGFPTWIIGDQRYEGILQPEELARYSGFDW